MVKLLYQKKGVVYMNIRKITFTESELLYMISTLDKEIRIMEDIVENTENNKYMKKRLVTLKKSYNKIREAYYN